MADGLKRTDALEDAGLLVLVNVFGPFSQCVLDHLVQTLQPAQHYKIAWLLGHTIIFSLYSY